MTTATDTKRIEALEKRVADLVNQVHFQDSSRVQIEKTIGVIDQQLIKTDQKVHALLGSSQGGAKKAKAKAKPVVTSKAKAKAKAKAKPAPKAKAKAKKKKK